LEPAAQTPELIEVFEAEAHSKHQSLLDYARGMIIKATGLADSA
jgi:hypothetical protein